MAHWWKYFASPFAPICQSLLFGIDLPLWSVSQFLSVFVGFRSPVRLLFSVHQSHRLCQEGSMGGIRGEGRKTKD